MTSIRKTKKALKCEIRKLESKRDSMQECSGYFELLYRISHNKSNLYLLNRLGNNYGKFIKLKHKYVNALRDGLIVVKPWESAQKLIDHYEKILEQQDIVKDLGLSFNDVITLRADADLNYKNNKK